MPFTAAELEEMRLADEEIEREFRLTREDLKWDREMEREIRLERMLPERRRIAEYHKAYYEANRDAIAEYQKAYYEANRDAIAEYQKAYREANRDAIAEKQKAYREANRDAIAEKQKWIRDARRQRGYTQEALARLLGVSQSNISRLESGELALDSFAKKDELLTLLGKGDEQCIDAI